MPGNHHLAWFMETKWRQIVEDMDGHRIDLQVRSARHGARPAAAIIIAAYGGHRRQRAQRIQNFRCADVAGMNDVVGAAQESQGFGTQQAVRVRDQPDALQRMKLTVPREASSIASRMASRVLILSPLFADSSV